VNIVEYGLIIAGVALVHAAAISMFGHKTSDLVAATAAVLPGAHSDDNGPIVLGTLIETTQDGTSEDITLGTVATLENKGTERLGNNLGVASGSGTGFGGLVLEAQ